MLASIKGTVKDIFQGFVIIDVNGLGYKIEGIAQFLEVGSEVDLYVYTHYTQQDIRLFGFPEREAYLLFQELLIVPGVGPRTAVNLINNLGVEAIKTAIVSDEPKALTGNGVGLKTAQKIILELAQKINKSGFLPSAKKKLDPNKEIILTEVEQALLGLGYNKKEIEIALSKTEAEGSGGEINSEALLRAALNHLIVKR